MNPPVYLSEAGIALWDAVSCAIDLDGPKAELLTLACKQADRAAEARRILQTDTIVGADRFGQAKPHPAVAIERMASLACAKLTAQVMGSAEDAEEPAPAEEDFYT